MKKLINLFHYVSLIALAVLSIIILFVPSFNIWEKIGLYIGLTLVNDLINFKTMIKIVDNLFVGHDSLSELKMILGLKQSVNPIGGSDFDADASMSIKEPRIIDNFDLVIDPDGHIRLVDKMPITFKPLTPEELMKKIESMDK